MNLRFLALVVGLAAGLVGHTASAQVVAPSQGGEVRAIRVTATTMELSFGTTGSGQGRVVSIAATPSGAVVPLAATDGNFYTAAAAFGKGDPIGKGYVVYSGTGHSVTVTGLEPSTYYYVTNAEYNADAAHIIYNTRGSNMTTATRNAPTPSAPLPVELTAFTGTVNTRGVAQLQWTTASERNTNYFALERAMDGSNFIEADRVPAAGTSSQQLSYQWLDPLPIAKSIYYRLRQVDRDGAVHYSGVVTLTPSLRMLKRIEVYPNPSNGQTMLLSLQGFQGESFIMQLSDALGRSFPAEAVAPTNAQYSLSLPQGLPSGTYLLTLTGGNSSVKKRIVVSN